MQKLYNINSTKRTATSYNYFIKHLYKDDLIDDKYLKIWNDEMGHKCFVNNNEFVKPKDEASLLKLMIDSEKKKNLYKSTGVKGYHYLTHDGVTIDCGIQMQLIPCTCWVI